MNCHICCEKRSTSFKCPYCEVWSCRPCIERYLLSISELPKCPSCGKQYKTLFLYSVISKKFVDNDLKTHIYNTLYEQEKALVEKMKVNIETGKATFDESQLEKLVEEEKQIKNKIADLQSLLRAKELAVKVLKDEKRKLLKGEIPDVSNAGFFPCPMDDCKGYILHDWKCGICKTQVCTRCRVIFKPGHLCKQEDIDSLKMIGETSKPCPNCKVSIQRTEGCRQMFCVNCQTRFDWQTLKIISSSSLGFHNVHEEEWRRIHGSAARPAGGHAGCGDWTQSMGTMTSSISYVLKLSYLEYDKYVTLHMKIHNLITKLTLSCQKIVSERAISNRFRFVQGKITEATFKRNVAINEKSLRLYRELIPLLITCGDVIYECFREIYLEVKDKTYHDYKTRESGLEFAKKVIEKITRWIEYVNKELENIAKEYKRKVPYINSSLDLVNTDTFTDDSGKTASSKTFIILRDASSPSDSDSE